RTATFAYDPAGNLVWEVHPQRYDTDAGGNPTPPADRVDVKTAYGYDLHNRRTSVTEAYTVNGQPSQLQRTTTTAYDAADHVTAVTRPFDYDLDENLDLNPNAVRVTTSYLYDALGRQTAVVEAVQQGPVPENTQPLQRTSTMLYDAADHLVAETRP